MQQARTLAAIVGLAALLLSAAGCAHTASVAEVSGAAGWRPNYEIHREKLANGLTVLYVLDHTVPVVSYTTWVRVGSAWEKKGATGIAHLFEHLMFKGTPRYPAKKFFDNLESKGAMVNAFTQRDSTVYYEIIDAKHLETVIDMESDRLQNLTFTQKELDSERQVVKEERRLRVESNFGEQHMEAVDKLAFPTHPYGEPVIGSMADLDRFTLEQCREFFKTYYQPGNAIVTIAGDFDYEQARRWMRRYYAPIEGRDVPPLTIEDEKPPLGERRLTIEKPVESESIVIAYHIPSMYDSDSAKLSMLAWALFGMSSSPARISLIRQKQLAIDVAADAQDEPFPYLFIVSAGMRRGETTVKAEAEIERLIEVAKTQPVTEAVLNRVKNGLIYMAINELKTPAGISNWLTWGEFYWRDPNKVFAKLAEYEAMRPGDLVAVARKYLNKDNRVVVVMKPSGTP